MTNINLTKARKDLQMSAGRFEKVLSQIGWLKNGEAQPAAQHYLTEQRELTPRGQGFLHGYLASSSEH